MRQQAEAAIPVDELEEANLFDVAGPIVLSYSRSSITGAPLFSYRDAERDLNFSGPDISRADSPLGELVTVTVDAVVDAFVRTFTLLVPKIRLRLGDEVEFDTLGIETTDRSGAFVPPPGPAGVLQTYRVHSLRGAAKRVAF